MSFTFIVRQIFLFQLLLKLKSIIFRHATTSAPSGSHSHESGPSNFFGTGYKLGQTENDTEG